MTAQPILAPQPSAPPLLALPAAARRSLPPALDDDAAEANPQATDATPEAPDAAPDAPPEAPDTPPEATDAEAPDPAPEALDAEATDPAPVTPDPAQANPAPSPPLVRVPPRAALPRPRPEPVHPRDAPLPPLQDGMLGVVDELLRDRDRLLTRIERAQDLTTIARAALVVTVVCMAAFGASIGFFRGGAQLAFAAVKLPAVLLMAVVVCAPVYITLRLAFRHTVNVAADFTFLLCATALSSLVAMALAPFLVAGILHDIGYHRAILATVAICGLGALAGARFFFQGINRIPEHGHRLIAVALLCVMGLVGTQLTWVMRPYLVRPASDSVPFVRSVEGGFLSAVTTSAASAGGRYTTPAPAPPNTSRSPR